MTDKAKATIVGLTFVITIIALIGGILFLKEYKFGQKLVYYKVSFPDVGTLTIGDPVLISGMKVGRVAGMELRYKDVLVTLGIDSKYKAPIDSRFYIRSLGIMGERMVVIELGKSDMPLDPNKEYVGVYETGIGEAMGGIGILLKKVDTMLVMVKKISDSTIGKEEFVDKFNGIVDNIAQASADLNSLVKYNKDDISKSITLARENIEKLPALMSALQASLDNLNKVVENVDSMSTDLKVVVTNAKSISKETDEIIKKLNNGDGTIAKIINDKEFYENLLGMINKLDSLSKILTKKGIKIRFF